MKIKFETIRRIMTKFFANTWRLLRPWSWKRSQSFRRPWKKATQTQASSSWPISYDLVPAEQGSDEYFLKLKTTIFEKCKRISHQNEQSPLFYESGHVGPGRKYFYLKPKNNPGWLFEQSATGWVVSRSEKLVGQDLFLRRGSAFDIVSLYKPRSLLKRVRVFTSLKGQEELMSFSHYCTLIYKTLLNPPPLAERDEA